MIRVLLVDDQSLLRMGFRLILDGQDDIDVVGEAGDGAAGVSMVRALQPDVVLMDVRMPGTDGISATAQIVASGSSSRVLILTTFDLDQYVLAGLRAGASGFLLKDVSAPELLSAIRTVAGGDSVLAPTATRRLIDQFLPLIRAADPALPAHDVLESLTDRERDVFSHLVTGLSNRQIATELSVSEGTVKIHVGRILAKLGLKDRVQAVVFAYESGLVTPGG